MYRRNKNYPNPSFKKQNVKNKNHSSYSKYFSQELDQQIYKASPAYKIWKHICKHENIRTL